jgi:hypothetical protein
MTPAGWIFMLASFTLISMLVGFCLYRTLRGNGPDDAQ